MRKKDALGLKLTQSSPLLMLESAMTTLSLRNMSHPSVFFAAFLDVDTADMVMLRYVMSCPSFTWGRADSVARVSSRWVTVKATLTKLIHSGPLIIRIFWTVTFVAWKTVSRMGRNVELCFALRHIMECCSETL